MSRILIKNIKALLQADENPPQYRKGAEMQHIPQIENAWLAAENGIITAFGTMDELEGVADWRDLEIIDASGKYVLPAFCDSHTHAVFARSREEEFVDRIKGLSYEEIAARGGGILNSARRLNEKSEDELFEDALQRIKRMMSFGTGAIEIKSGYGLSTEAELKMLRVIKRLKQTLEIPVKATFLGAHAFPAEYKQDHEPYLRMICDEMLPQIAAEELADYVDVFCERNYYSVEEMERVLKAAQPLGLKPKVHVNQFSVLGGVSKAIEYGALSVDHLEELDDADITALQQSHCMPTLLPACSHFINIPFAPARKMIDAGLPVALASDFNPGSTPCGNLQMVMNLACVKQRMTPEEALNALTLNAAYAMGLEQEMGSITPGKKARLLLTREIPSLAFIPYAFGDNHIERTIGF